MAEGYRIAPLPAPVLIQKPVVGPPRLLDPDEFAPPIKVPNWDLSGLQKGMEGLGEFISEIFPSEQKKLEREARKVSLETAKIRAAADAAEAARTVNEINNPDLEIERKVRTASAVKRAEGDIGYEDNLRTAIIGRYGLKGIKALNAAKLSGKDVRSVEGQESVLNELENELPKHSPQDASLGVPATQNINAILDQPIDTPEQGALAVKQLKELGYDATLSQGPSDKLGMRSWKLGIKGYNPTNSSPTLSSSLPKDEAGVPDLNDPIFTIPLSTVDPYSHIQNSKAKDQARVAAAKLADKYIADNAKNVETARDTLEKANTFLELNKKNNYPIYNRLIPKWAPDLGGMTGSSDIENMRSITNALTPRMRQGMPGSASNLDVQMFRGATLDPTRPLAANERIGKALIARSQDAIDEQQFKSQYAVYNGDLKGADSAWQQYLDNNPIFDPKAKQSDYKINENRLSWQDFFKLRNIDTLAKKKLISPEIAEQEKSKLLPRGSIDTNSAPSMSQVTATGPNGEKIQLVNGQWVPMS